MKPEIVKRGVGPGEVVLRPTHEEGVFISGIDSENRENIIDGVGRGILLDLPPGMVGRTEDSVDTEIGQFVELNPRRIGEYVLRPGIKGVLFETINRRGDLVDRHPMASRAFTEYLPFSEA